MVIDLNCVKEYTGWLFKLKDNSAIKVVYLRFDSSSAKKLAETVLSKQVMRKNQNLFIEKISIDEKQLDCFKEGQSELRKTPNGYALSANSSKNPVMFRGEMEAEICGEDGKSCTCYIEIASIVFDLEKATETSGDGIVSFSNVDAVMYPGVYRVVLDGEE